jgi:4a-hydroxytetrahydrobiopterin dehydratase
MDKAIFKKLINWNLHNEQIEKEFIFANFPEAISFVSKVAIEAEKMNHHPDIDIRYNRVKLLLTTKDLGGLSVLDYDLAKKIDGIVLNLH